MREHLFRGFHPDDNGKTTITLNGEKIKGEWVVSKCILQFSDSAYLPMVYGNIEVILETVGECTGLPDVNRKRIFEGDIVCSLDCERGDDVGVVVWDDVRCMYWVHSEKYDWWLVLNEVDGWKVIGNIYENPELLEVCK